MNNVLARLFARPGKKLRIAYGRLFHEANAYSPIATTLADFERHGFVVLAERPPDELLLGLQGRYVRPEYKVPAA